MYKIIFSKHAIKDAGKIKKSNLKEKCLNILNILSSDPFSIIPPYEKLAGDLKGFYFRRINIQHRLIYQVNEQDKIVKILRMWSHYD